MMWIGAALLGYFCSALSQILDKFLLTEGRIPKPPTYAFYVSLFSAFGFVFSVFGLKILPADQMLLFLIAGFIFTYFLLTFFYAVRDYDIARVAPLQGLFTTFTVVAFTFLLPEFFGEPEFHWQLVAALGLFIVGGALISYDLPFTKADHLPFSVILSGFLVGVYFLLLKIGYARTDFINGLVWSRVGIFLGAFSLLLFPTFRHQIFTQQKKKAKKKERKKNLATLGLFVFNKTNAGIASLLILYAISLGSTSLVQALNGMQYVFLLFLLVPFTYFFPKIFPDRLPWSDWLQKIFALLLIALGFYFLAFSGIIIR